MADVTATLSFSLDLTTWTDISAYWERDDGYDLPGIGRNEDLGLADSAEASFTLDNRDGRFTPKNSGSPYYDNFHTQIHIKATVTFNAVTHDAFFGVITRIEVNPDGSSQKVTVTARDQMYVLERTDVRIPLMQTHTGPIINRIIDYCELNEAVGNPRMEENLSGYEALSGTITRMTTDNLEGPASMKVTSTATNGGGRYTLGTTFSGDKMTAVFYARAETDTEIGKTLRIRMSDNTGSVAAGSYIALSQRWKRFSVTGTYGGATQYINFEAGASGTAWRIGALHCTPFVSAITRLVDEGQSVLDAFTYPPRGRGSGLEAIQEVTENELGALFYMDGAGNAVFEDKTHRWLGDHLTSQLTLTERGRISYEEVAEDRVKEVVFDFPRFVEGAAGTELWHLDRVPVTIEASGTVSFEVDYQGGIAKNVIVPVGNTDYLCNGNPDGTGANETGNVLVTVWHDFGEGAEITLENQQTYPVFLTFLRIRGTPIRVASDRTPVRYTASSGPSISAPISHSFRQNGREAAISSWARYIGDRYATPRERMALELTAAFPTVTVAQHITEMTAIWQRKVSDRVTVVNTTLPFSTKVNGPYYIDRVDRSIVGGENSHAMCKWVLVPVDASMFTIGTSTIGGTDVIAP